MTFAEFHALDPAALWAALSPEVQASINVPLLTSQFAEVCAEDDGTDCSIADQEAAAGIVQDRFQEAMDAIGAAFPAILADDETALHTLYRDDLAAAIDDAETVEVHGLPGRHSVFEVAGSVLHHDRQVSIGGRLHDVAPAGRPHRWVAWTQEQIDAERLRRHPEFAVLRAAA